MRLLHVNVVVPPGKTHTVLGFYELLGFTQVAKPTEGVADTGAWFDLADGTQLHVSERDSPRNPDQHFALSVEDLEDIASRLQAAGHPWKAGPDLLGARRGNTADPEGNKVELIEAVGPFA